MARTQFETQAFTRFTSWNNFHLERLQAPSGAFTNPDGGVLKSNKQVLLHCIQTVRAGFERFELVSRHIQIPFKDMSSLIQYLILFEYGSNPGSKRSNAIHILSYINL